MLNEKANDGSNFKKRVARQENDFELTIDNDEPMEPLPQKKKKAKKEVRALNKIKTGNKMIGEIDHNELYEDVPLAEPTDDLKGQDIEFSPKKETKTAFL